MRRAWSLCAALVLLAGCEDGGGGDDESDTGDMTGGPDAATGDPDAGPGDPDAAAPEPDAAEPMPDAGPPVVTLTFTTGSAGYTGAFAFYDPAGNLITHGLGSTFSYELAAGSMVVASPNGSSSVYVWKDVQPGDNLVVRFQPDGGETDTTITVPTVAGADYYEVTTRCGSASSISPSLTVPLANGCTATDVAVSAYFDGDLLGTAFKLNQAVTPGTPVNLSSLTMRPPLNQTITLAGVPGDSTHVRLAQRTRYGLVFSGHEVSASYAVGAPTMSLPGAMADPGDQGVLHAAMIIGPSGTLFAERMVAGFGEITYASHDMDRVSAATWTAATRTASWTSGGGSVGGPKADITYTHLRYQVMGNQVDWHILDKGDASEFVVFPLVGNLADKNLPDPAPFVVVEVTRVDSPYSASFLREKAFQILGIRDLMGNGTNLTYSVASNQPS